MSMLRITHIAVQIPDQPELRLLREIGVLDSMSDVVVSRIAGEQVTRTALARILRQPTDLVILSGHGAPGRIYLSHDSVSAKWLATQLKAGAPRLAVMAMCGSDVGDDKLRAVTTAIAHTGINVIGFPISVDDVVAGAYIVELVRALVAGADIAQAHEVAVEEIGGDDLVAARGIELRAGLFDGYRPFLDQMLVFDQRLLRVEHATMILLDHFGISADAA